MGRLYSQRMLNPFHGIVNIAEIEGADAVCRDGIDWTLYIQGGMEAAESGDAEAQVALPDIKFGTWTAGNGLRRAPVRFVADYDRLDALGCRLLELVKSASGRLPFPLRDCYELWLLESGAEALPVALLQSRCDPPEAGPAEITRWTAGQRARLSFRLAAEDAQFGSAVAADRLTQKVNAAAGTVPRTQWFQRRSDGSGHGLSASAGSLSPIERGLPARAFPELLLREEWDDPAAADLARGYLAWQAPWLLSLQSLRSTSRRRLEIDACKRALLVSELFRTYPEIIDRAAIKAAQVEARLRLAAGVEKEQEGSAESSFFVTGN